MLLPVILIVIGFAALIFGANYLVDGASSLARKYKVSDLMIGLTIVAFGTSAPELVVNAIASFEGHSDIVFGNVIGSNNFNLFIILGIAGLIYPIQVSSSTVKYEIPISLLAAIILLFLANNFFISDQTGVTRLDGILMLICFGLFLWYVFVQMKKDEKKEEIIKPMSNAKTWGFIIAGFIGLILGGQLVVTNSITIAEDLGVSQKIIGMTIIAAGTSLPELVTSVVAALKKNSDIAMGNVIGSNIFNILLILSISSVIAPIGFNKNFNVDITILSGGTVFLLLAMFTGKRKSLDRWEAAILAGFYLIYTIYLVSKEL